MSPPNTTEMSKLPKNQKNNRRKNEEKNHCLAYIELINLNSFSTQFIHFL